MTFPFAKTLAALVLSAAAQPALAHEFKVGDLTIGHPYAIETAATAQTGAGYLSITNTGTSPDTLTTVIADFPKVQVHTTQTADGVARMVAVETVPIAPGETVTFEPKGLHVMFMGLPAPFKAGDKIPATLVFEHAGKVDVTFNVEPRKDGGMEMNMKGMDHSGHDMPAN